MGGIFYAIKQGFRQVFKNKGMSLPSILSISAMLLILGVFLTINVNLNILTETVRSDYDEVEAFLLDSVTEDSAKSIMSQVEKKEGVLKVEYRSKDDALEILKERWGESAYLLDNLGNNPLPASIVVTVDSLERATEISDYLGKIDGIDDTQYYKETVEKLTKITRGLSIACAAIMAFLALVSIIVVSNTVKLTVIARANEIQIMKYVGATNWFVRGPFMAEGTIIGLISALIATGVVTLIYREIISKWGMAIISLLQCPIVQTEYMAKNILVIFIVLGASIGALGSLVSMKRFLKA